MSVEPQKSRPIDRNGYFVGHERVLRLHFAKLEKQQEICWYTEKLPSKKLQEHNAGATRWTRQNRPFVLAHHEAFDDARSARQREIFLKSGKGRHLLDEILQNTDGGPAGN